MKTRVTRRRRRLDRRVNEEAQEGSGCNEDQATREEDEDLVYKQATATTGPLSVSRAFEEITKKR